MFFAIGGWSDWPVTVHRSHRRLDRRLRKTRTGGRRSITGYGHASAGPRPGPCVPRQRRPGAGLVACGKRTDTEHPGSAWWRARLPHVGSDPASIPAPLFPPSPLQCSRSPAACPPRCAGRDLHANAIAPPCRNNRLEGEEGEPALRYATGESGGRWEIGREEETKNQSRTLARVCAQTHKLRYAR